MFRSLARVFSVFGPGLIIASVALGPGSVTTASSIGADYGYSLIWMVVLSAAAMMVYTVMGARFGATHEQSFLQVVAERYGRWLAVLIGLASFLMSGSFQFGNNLGVSTAMVAVTEVPEFRLELVRSAGGPPMVVAGSMTQVWPFVFTGSALAFVLFAKNLYAVVEKLMKALVLIMIGAFAANLAVARPDLAEAARGMVPSVPRGDRVVERMAAMVGTTFVLHACIYQAYLVQAKGWKLDDVRKSVRDSIAGITVLGTISVLIMMTSASALRPKGIHIENAADMARQLEALFGPYARVIFSLGLWAAAFSSIPVNAIIGGGLLADGLGLGSTMNQALATLLHRLDHDGGNAGRRLLPAAGHRPDARAGPGRDAAGRAGGGHRHVPGSEQSQGHGGKRQRARGQPCRGPGPGADSGHVVRDLRQAGGAGPQGCPDARGGHGDGRARDGTPVEVEPDGTGTTGSSRSFSRIAITPADLPSPRTGSPSTSHTPSGIIV